MKRKNVFLMMALMAVTVTGFLGCSKNYIIRVSTQNLWFGLEAETQTLEITANCEWTITRNDNADWYTISQMSGKKDGVISVTVEALEDGDYRGSTFVISSPGGHVRRTIFVSQNKLDFDGMVNKVFGVMELEHWNTDFFDQMIEDSYKHAIYDPYDTTTGYHMFFLENGHGIQRDHHDDTVVYYSFTYEYNPIDQILHIDFETVTGAPESYSPNVLTASDSLYRFMHEYKPNFFERVDMRKVGTYIPEEITRMRSVATKRKGGEGIFRF
jgi:hypothetical protein